MFVIVYNDRLTYRILFVKYKLKKFFFYIRIIYTRLYLNIITTNHAHNFSMYNRKKNNFKNMLDKLNII